jgi:hypothetical protein
LISRAVSTMATSRRRRPRVGARREGVHDGDERVGARRSSTVPTRERFARGATVNDATDRPNEGSIRRASIRAWTTAGSRRGVESLCNYTVPDET